MAQRHPVSTIASSRADQKPVLTLNSDPYKLLQTKTSYCAFPHRQRNKADLFSCPSQRGVSHVLEEKEEAQQVLDELFTKKLLPQDDAFSS